MFYGELKLCKMNRKEVYDWIKLRTDYNSIKYDLLKQIPQLAMSNDHDDHAVAVLQKNKKKKKYNNNNKLYHCNKVKL